jgi:hypothetical protein
MANIKYSKNKFEHFFPAFRIIKGV